MNRQTFASSVTSDNNPIRTQPYHHEYDQFLSSINQRQSTLISTQAIIKQSDSDHDDIMNDKQERRISNQLDEHKIYEIYGGDPPLTEEEINLNKKRTNRRKREQRGVIIVLCCFFIVFIAIFIFWWFNE